MSRFTRLYLRIPRPKTGTELISLALVFNKVTGVYGLLAILTGFQLSLFQLTTYVYCIGILAILVFLIPHIRKQTPFECLALAWLYVIDTAINAASTAAFGVDWYFANAASTVAETMPSSLPDVIAEGMEGLRREAANGGVMPQETAASMVLITGLTLIRIYFSLVVMNFARQVLQKYMQLMILEGPGVDDHVGPFAADLPDGEGRKGKLGRLMVSFGRGYWMDYSEAGEWVVEGSRKPSSAGAFAGEYLWVPGIIRYGESTGPRLTLRLTARLYIGSFPIKRSPAFLLVLANPCQQLPPSLLSEKIPPKQTMAVPAPAFRLNGVASHESDDRDLSESDFAIAAVLWLPYGCSLAGGAHADCADLQALSDHAILENSGFCGEWKFG
ncbi:hypothetical protein TARUN_8286 [Trichoderma arundinaceum]|uniref:Inositol phoshorylceramide synthase regulatory subunit kei1 n=1 Tax=Trichoderma arundinaceum TaxID=490622 RepID=A0A395ND10_TRIAR|nr:hypothetical protein TARUN_8286 [Trichoderma arundinaceum]